MLLKHSFLHTLMDTFPPSDACPYGCLELEAGIGSATNLIMLVMDLNLRERWQSQNLLPV